MAFQSAQLYPVPAVRAIIEDSEGRVLILKRANTNYGEGGWCLPGGKIDYGQTVEEALSVEIKEELSLDLIESRFHFYQDSLPLEPGGSHYINFYFHCTTRGNVALNDESSDFAWIGLSDLDQYTIEFKNDDAIRCHLKENSNGDENEKFNRFRLAR